ncbi:MAG: thioesterase family protein [Mariniblastus sp.]|nr:thioesterase family protein [Mariniblastus sp.]
MIHRTELTIRTFHTDAFGHVNNSRYVELLEEARWRYAEDIGLVDLLKTEGLGFIIVDMRLRFRVPVFEGETIRVETSLESLGSASGDVKQWIYKSNETSVCLKSVFHFILIDRETAKSVPIEGAIRELLLKLVAN